MAASAVKIFPFFIYIHIRRRIKIESAERPNKTIVAYMSCSTRYEISSIEREREKWEREEEVGRFQGSLLLTLKSCNTRPGENLFTWYIASSTSKHIASNFWYTFPAHVIPLKDKVGNEFDIMPLSMSAA